jgi:outer membrane protein TolC
MLKNRNAGGNSRESEIGDIPRGCPREQSHRRSSRVPFPCAPAADVREPRSRSMSSRDPCPLPRRSADGALARSAVRRALGVLRRALLASSAALAVAGIGSWASKIDASFRTWIPCAIGNARAAEGDSEGQIDEEPSTPGKSEAREAPPVAGNTRQSDPQVPDSGSGLAPRPNATAAPATSLPPAPEGPTSTDVPEAEIIPSRPIRPIVIELTLEAALRAALERNFDIRVAKLDHLTTYHDTVIETAVWDPFFSMGANFSKNRRPSASFLDLGGGALVARVQPNPSETSDLSVGLRGLTPLGTTYNLRLSEASFDRPRASGILFGINPQVNSTASIEISQPLLKGAWLPFNRARLEIARNNEKLSRLEFVRSVTDTVFSIEQAYWELVFTLKNYESRAKALEVSSQDLRNARRRYRAGTYAPIDVTIVESQLALRRVEFTDAEVQLDDARDTLLDLIHSGGEASLRQRSERSTGTRGTYDRVLVIPTTETDSSPFEADRNRAIEDAVLNRSDLLQLQLEKKTQEIQVRIAENQTLPQLDLTARWDQQGLADDFDESFSSMRGGDFYSWAVGVRLEIPIPNRGPRRTLRKAEDALVRSSLLAAQLESTIVLEIDRSLRNLHASQKRVFELEERVKLQQTILEAERRKVAVGTSISYTVSTIENDLLDSQARALRAKADYEIAKAEYFRATGLLLERHELRLFDVAP